MFLGLECLSMGYLFKVIKIGSFLDNFCSFVWLNEQVVFQLKGLCLVEVKIIVKRWYKNYFGLRYCVFKK